jgi:uncharacterized membrane protein
MKLHLPLWTTILTVAALGCTQGTPGGPGATPAPRTTENRPPANTTTTTNKPVLGEADRTFTLSVPTLSTNVKQGETKAVSIGINRGKNFDQDVTLKLSGIPQGVTIVPAEPMIKHGEEDIEVKVTAAADAALGDFTIKVLGHPATGADAATDLKLTVSDDE